MSLKDRIIARIRSEGPLSLSDYMADCLMHPEWGYYATRDPLGAAGDFITAPEISQMFGEMIGLCIAQSWLDQGRPTPFVLAEAGPGRGTMMSDILRATRAVPGFADAVSMHLVETSPALRQVQAETLSGVAPVWHDGVQTLPDNLPLFFVANEFLDALPIRQFQRTETGWRERCVGLDSEELAFGLGPELPQPGLNARVEDTRAGDIVELCPQMPALAEAIGARIVKNGGMALFIDYGDWRSLGDTLQALENHTPVDPLAAPGQADLTAHVDFEVLAKATPSGFARLTPQGIFLERLGITARAQALARGKGDAEVDRIAAAHRRLTHPEEMGNLFKVMGFFPLSGNPPPGLEI